MTSRGDQKMPSGFDFSIQPNEAKGNFGKKQSVQINFGYKFNSNRDFDAK